MLFFLGHFFGVHLDNPYAEVLQLPRSASQEDIQLLAQCCKLHRDFQKLGGPFWSSVERLKCLEGAKRGPTY